MGMTGLMAGMAVGQAGLSIAGGYAQKREAEYNAALLRQQAGMVGEQQKLEAMRYDRAIRRAEGQTVARTAASGLELSGSPMAIMIDTITQMELDKAIGQYNLEVQKTYIHGQARQTQMAGRRAVQAGYTGAFSSLLQGGKQFLDAPAFTGKATIPKERSYPAWTAKYR